MHKITTCIKVKVKPVAEVRKLAYSTVAQNLKELTPLWRRSPFTHKFVIVDKIKIVPMRGVDGDYKYVYSCAVWLYSNTGRASYSYVCVSSCT